MDGEWFVDELRPPDRGDVEEIARELPGAIEAATRGAGGVPRLALLLREVVCHDVHKVFGAAGVRLDALVVHGRASDSDPTSPYMPGTFRFPDVRDHQQLPIDADHGLLIFNGEPLHFLDVFIMVSRDHKDSDDLATLLRQQMGDSSTREAMAALLALAVALPTVTAVTAAISAAAVLGDTAYRALRAVSDKTIGMYRGSFLQFRDGFGVGRHPEGAGTFWAKDLEFWYETVLDEPQAP